MYVFMVTDLMKCLWGSSACGFWGLTIVLYYNSWHATLPSRAALSPPPCRPIAHTRSSLRALRPPSFVRRITISNTISLLKLDNSLCMKRPDCKIECRHTTVKPWRYGWKNLFCAVADWIKSSLSARGRKFLEWVGSEVGVGKKCSRGQITG